MKFKDNDVVRILTDCEDQKSFKGEVGTIIMVFENPQEAYEVEVLDEDGRPKAQYAFKPDDLELVIF